MRNFQASYWYIIRWSVIWSTRQVLLTVKSYWKFYRTCSLMVSWLPKSWIRKCTWHCTVMLRLQLYARKAIWHAMDSLVAPEWQS